MKKEVKTDVFTVDTSDVVYTDVVLTMEMIEEAALKSMENFGVINGNMILVPHGMEPEKFIKQLNEYKYTPPKEQQMMDKKLKALNNFEKLVNIVTDMKGHIKISGELNEGDWYITVESKRGERKWDSINRYGEAAYSLDSAVEVILDKLENG
jgi:hypothetical protein